MAEQKSKDSTATPPTTTTTTTSRKEYENMTLEQLEYLLICKGHTKVSVFDKVRQLNRVWNKDLAINPKTAKCQVCSYCKHVDLAHVQAVCSFDKKTTLIKEINHPDNLFVLCKNCHWEFDTGLLKIEDVPKLR